MDKGRPAGTIDPGRKINALASVPVCVCVWRLSLFRFRFQLGFQEKIEQEKGNLKIPYSVVLGDFIARLSFRLQFRSHGVKSSALALGKQGENRFRNKKQRLRS